MVFCNFLLSNFICFGVFLLLVSGFIYIFIVFVNDFLIFDEVIEKLKLWSGLKVVFKCWEVI